MKKNIAVRLPAGSRCIKKHDFVVKWNSRMSKPRKLKVGNKIVEGGRVFRIFKITPKDDDRILHYRPFYVRGITATIECSIPESMLEEGNIRGPISRDDVGDLMEVFAKKTKLIQPLDTVKEKSKLLSNDIFSSANILKKYWRANMEDENLNKSKRDVLALAYDKVVEEIALIKGVSLDRAKESIDEALSSKL